MLVKVAAVQSQLGKMLSLDERLMIFRQRPDFVCLPEYCLVEKSDPDFSRSALKIKAHLDYFVGLSVAFSTCLIGGSVVEADCDSLFNSSYIFNHGEYIGKYRKLNPVSGEMEKGILPGDNFFTHRIDRVKIGVLICADALNIDLFKSLANENVDIIFIPTTSRLREGELTIEKYRRDNEIFVKAAQEASSYIVKTCGVGSLFGNRLQGRTLIAAPWGVIKRVEPRSEAVSTILTVVLDIDEIRDFRQKRQMIAKELADIIGKSDK
jgi:predicted amidohydrolase